MIKFFLYHTTIYSYTNPVIESTNKILLYPYNDLYQQLVNHRLNISGNPNISSYIDDFNNRIGFFTYTPPHSSLVINSEAEIISKSRPIFEEKMESYDQWKYLDEISNTIDYLPFLNVEKNNTLNEFNMIVSDLKKTTKTPYSFAKNVCSYINENFIYQKGITNVFSTIDDVWEIKTGVCQDFATIMIQLCRNAKIPTRYVSGYVFADEGLRGAGATHAWVEIFIPGHGWLGLDPTNNCIADKFHIRLAVGRNYDDCAPVKGVFRGNEKQFMDVKVQLDTKKRNLNYELINQDVVVEEVKEINSQNSYQKNLEMIQQQQQQQQQQ